MKVLVVWIRATDWVELSTSNCWENAGVTLADSFQLWWMEEEELFRHLFTFKALS